MRERSTTLTQKVAGVIGFSILAGCAASSVSPTAIKRRARLNSSGYARLWAYSYVANSKPYSQP
jgi:hypothetical protein